MARWVRDNTPPESRILCRKRAPLAIWAERAVCRYPFTQDADRVLRSILEQKADYVVVDALEWTTTTRDFLARALQAHPDLFEEVHAVGRSAIYRVKGSAARSP